MTHFFCQLSLTYLNLHLLKNFYKMKRIISIIILLSLVYCKDALAQCTPTVGIPGATGDISIILLLAVFQA